MAVVLRGSYAPWQKEALCKWMREPHFVMLSADQVSLRGVAQYYRVVCAADCSLPSHSGGGGPAGGGGGGGGGALPKGYALFLAKSQCLLSLLGEVSFHQCVVFTNDRTRARELVALLNHHGYPAAFMVSTCASHPNASRSSFP